MNESHFSYDTVEAFKALGDPIRVQLIQKIVEEQEVACTTFEELFLIGKSTISYHVKVLKHTGLMKVRKDGRYYHHTMREDILTEYDKLDQCIS